MVIQTVIADDEPLARQKLRILLRQAPDVQVVGEAASPSEIVAQVQAKKPDLLFLDICMPAKNGLDVMAELSTDKNAPLPYIIITTAHGDYAVRGRRLSCARVFGDVPCGEIFWYENSVGLVEIAANRASAAIELGLEVGDRLGLTVR